QPSLILLDLMMPVMNGWEFRAEQLQDPELAEIPVVVVTGALRHPGSASGIEGAGLLTKPVDVPQLLETVARCSAGQSDWGSRDQSSR
ncbi:MAG: response regulator, partial [Armatimonadetes bacterium]|nr:response regulator [Armatimonadota bacterium]